ncbi:SURF1 family protein [Profundibacter sp.]|uniref:SURF1 family protein n=1 Tax=Profundibacter sp. TaxID=3101071 RepID=UPI003D139377
MKKPILVPLLFGLVGAAILVSLGIWQLQRLQWKTAMLAEIDRVIAAEPVPLPDMPNEVADQFLPVDVQGVITQDEIHVLASTKDMGPGYRIISVFETDGGRRIMLDRGFVAVPAKDAPRPAIRARIIGNLLWPDEGGAAIPDPEIDKNIWFARDVAAMATVLNTEPVLLVQRLSSEKKPVTTPFPVTSAGIPNRHLEYVVTWFGLALVWLGMTAYLIWRIRRRNE